MRKNLREAESKGFRAYKRGVPLYKNPLAGSEASAWSRGWRQAKTATDSSRENSPKEHADTR